MFFSMGNVCEQVFWLFSKRLRWEFFLSCNRWPNLRQKIEGHLSLLLECRGLRCCCRETSPWRATRTSNSLVPRTPEPKSYIQFRKIKSCASWAFLVQINNQSAEIWRIFNIFYHSRRLALIFINEIQCSVLKQSYREQYRNQMKFTNSLVELGNAMQNDIKCLYLQSSISIYKKRHRKSQKAKKSLSSQLRRG